MTPGPRLLRPTDVGRRLESAVAMIRAELAALPDDVLKEVLGHLIERAAASPEGSASSSRSRGHGEWVDHDRNHLRQVLANVQALAWPHMGNARRLSEE